MGEKGFRLAGSGFGVKARRIKNRSAVEHNEWRCPKVAGSKFPILNFPNIAHLTANDKDFSLALEMTIRENLISPSHQSLEASSSSLFSNIDS